MPEIMTCPRCGALVVPQLARCRRCKLYLHGTALEGMLVDLLPEQYAHAPGTALLSLLIVAYYVVMAARARNAVGFSSFSLQQLGALHGPDWLDGQYFRLVTYMFGHHDLVHLAFNLSALVTAGSIVERLFDRKKMILMYLASGVVAGLGSILYYVYIRGGVQLLFVSAGASGAVSGMIGAAWIGARRLGMDGKAMAQRMAQWALYMVVFGFAVPGINNAAHFSGFVAGAALARVIPLGLTGSPRAQRALSALVLASFAGVVACGVQLVQQQRGFPMALAQDAESRSILGVKYFQGVDPEGSDQERIWNDCVNAGLVGPPPADQLHACELNLRVNTHDHRSYTKLAGLLEARGAEARAARLRKIAALLPRGGE
jgi:membrane associated rhomboid family serine protease